MDLFISWSGERSELVANALAQWLPKVIQAVRPWLSSESIDPGIRWGPEVANALERSTCGVLCLTPENLSSPWMLFEAGALSRSVSTTRVIPYLLGFQPQHVQGPLSQFQSVPADYEGTLRLVRSINAAAEAQMLVPERLDEAFQVWWPSLREEIAQIEASMPQNTHPPQRSLESMVGEILELTRTRSSASNDLEMHGDLASVARRARLGDQIRTFRVARMLTQEQLAAVVGISQSELSKIENGVAIPSLETFDELANAFQITPSFLISLTDAPRGEPRG